MQLVNTFTIGDSAARGIDIPSVPAGADDFHEDAVPQADDRFMRTMNAPEADAQLIRAVGLDHGDAAPRHPEHIVAAFRANLDVLRLLGKPDGIVPSRSPQ
jgi:hypothetical protein